MDDTTGVPSLAMRPVLTPEALPALAAFVGFGALLDLFAAATRLVEPEPLAREPFEPEVWSGLGV